MDLPSRIDLFAVARRSLRLSKANSLVRINPALIDVDGSELNLIFGAASLMGETIVAAWATCILGLILDKASGDQLDALAYDRFGETRKDANAATTLMSIARPNNSGGAGVIPAGTRIQTAGGNVFELQADVVFGALDVIVPNSTNTSDVVAVALLVGPEQNVDAGKLRNFVDVPFDSTMSTINISNAAGGTLREADPDFRARVRNAFLSERRGTIAAVEFGATKVAGVAVATAFDIENPGTGLPAGAGELVIGDKAGNASPQMVQDTKNELLNWRPIGIPVFTQGGFVVFEKVILTLEYETGVDTVRAQSDVRAVVVAVTQFLAGGESLLRSTITAAIRTVPGVIARQGAIIAPAGDVDTTANSQIIRVRPQDVSFV